MYQVVTTEQRWPLKDKSFQFHMEILAAFLQEYVVNCQPDKKLRLGEK